MKRILFALSGMVCAGAAWAAVLINTNVAFVDYVQVTNAVAQANSGDTILIATGVYNEVVNIYGINLTLDGGYTNDCSYKIAGARSVIDADTLLGSGSALDITGSVVRLISLDVRGGELPFGGSVLHGGGLDIRSGSIVTAESCRVYDNEAYGKGGGVHVEGSSLFLVNTEVFSNQAYRTTGLALPPSAYGWGGGVCVDNGLLDIAGDSDIWANYAFNEGGGLCAQDSRTTIRNTNADILDNVASNGGGVVIIGGYFRLDSGADVAANVAEGRGGGILLRSGATGEVSGSGTSVGYDSPILGKNQVTNGVGGGVCVLDSVLIVSNLARVAFNSATVAGGGIYASNAVVLLDQGYVGFDGQTNSAASGGGIGAVNSTITLAGASYVRGGRAMGGGGILADNCDITVGPDAIIGEANALEANQAWVGGGIYAGDSRIEVQGKIWNNSAFLGDGGGLALEDSELVASNAQFIGNLSAARGGGVSLVGGTGTFWAVQVISNSAAMGGGLAFANVAGAAIRGSSRVSSNSASQHGGGLYHSSTGSTFIRDGLFENNYSAGHGGAISVLSGVVEIWDGGFYYNVAAGDGGGIYASNAVVVVSAGVPGVTLYGNQAYRGGGIAVRDLGFANLAGEGDMLVTGNRAGLDGGGLWSDGGTVLAYGRLYFGGNTASNLGGGIYAARTPLFHMGPRVSGLPYIYNNRAGLSGGGVCLNSNTIASMNDTRIGYTDPLSSSPNYAHGTNSFEGGGGVAVLSGSRLYATNLWVGHNVSSNAGGGIYVNNARLVVKGDLDRTPADGFMPPNRFEYNRAVRGNGGGVCGIMSTFEVWDALVFSNRAQRGGGIQVDATATGTFVNTVIADNTASVAGGGVRVFSPESKAELLHCNLTYNWGDGLSGDPASRVDVTYGIAWGNSGSAITPGHAVNYCDVQGGYAGAGNFSAPPDFKDWPVGDYRLLFGSPCIDQATAGLLWPIDCIGETRPFGAFADLGAYEYNRDTYDSDDDTIPDGWEDDRGMNPLLAADALQNGDPDPYLNIEEYISDTDPFDGDSHLKIASITNGATRDVSFLSSTGRLYALYATPYMTNDATWVVVGTNFALRGNGATYTAVDTNAPMGHAFYRVDVRLP